MLLHVRGISMTKDILFRTVARLSHPGACQWRSWDCSPAIQERSVEGMAPGTFFWGILLMPSCQPCAALRGWDRIWMICWVNHFRSDPSIIKQFEGGRVAWDKRNSHAPFDPSLAKWGPRWPLVSQFQLSSFCLNVDSIITWELAMLRKGNGRSLICGLFTEKYSPQYFVPSSRCTFWLRRPKMTQGSQHILDQGGGNLCLSDWCLPKTSFIHDHCPCWLSPTSSLALF